MLVFLSVLCAICAVICTGLLLYEFVNLKREQRENEPGYEDFPEDEAPPNGWQVNDVNFYDREEIIPNCTVQILTNTVTGKQSVGWRRNDAWDDFSEATE